MKRQPDVILPLVIFLFSVAVVPLLPLPSHAADKYWVGGSGWWDIGPWSLTPGGPGVAAQPQAGDTVYLTQADVTNRTVSYWNLLYLGDVLSSLQIDATGFGTMTLSQSRDPLNSNNEYVGYGGLGTHLQSGGTNTITSNLYVGYNSTSRGTYALSGSGSLSAIDEYIGYNGFGTFTQTGGTNTIDDPMNTSNLYLGYESTGNGTYDLSGTGALSAQFEMIGRSGAGTFHQTGGTHTIRGGVYLGALAGSNGTYNLGGDGTLTTGIKNSGGGDEIFGYRGTGTFRQTGGTHTSYGNLTLGDRDSGIGTYELSEGTLSAHAEFIGDEGTGTFQQTGGTNRIILEGLIPIPGNLSLGSQSGSRGTYNLSLTGVLSTASESIGINGIGMFNQDGGTNTLTGTLFLGKGPDGIGTYEQLKGTLSAYMEMIGVSGTGTFRQFAGTNTISEALHLGYNSAGIGTYDLSGGDLSAGSENIGTTGTGTFTQTGGTNTVTTILSVGQKGTYNLTDGTLKAGTLDLLGGGTFYQNGGTLDPATTFNQKGGTVNGRLENLGTFNYESGTFNGRLINNGTANFNADFTAGDGMRNNSNLAVGAGRTLTFNGAGLTNSGNIALSGGILAGNGLLRNNQYLRGYGTIGGSSSSLSNSGTMTLTGGTSTVNGSVTNQSGGNIEVAHNPGIFTGNVLNAAGGVFKVTQTDVTFTGTFTNNGAYISDPSTTHAADIVVGSTGYLIGGVGDEWILSNDFVNQSAQNSLWSTGAASLGFVAGADGVHDLYIPGSDLGAVASGYANNFAWGTLSIGLNNDLVLQDGNAGNWSTALYVGQILGLELTGLTVENITGNGFNIYYNPTLNGALNGLTYALAGGGHLIAAGSVPLPGSLLLFGSGLLGLIGIGRRRSRKQ